MVELIEINKEVFSLYPVQYHDELHEELENEASIMASVFMALASVNEEFISLINNNTEHVKDDIKEIIYDKVTHVYKEFAKTNGFTKQELSNQMNAMRKYDAVWLINNLHSILYPYAYRYIFNKNKAELAVKHNLNTTENFNKDSFEEFKHESCHKYGLMYVKEAIAKETGVQATEITNEVALEESKKDYKKAYNRGYSHEWHEEGFNIIQHYIQIANGEEIK